MQIKAAITLIAFAAALTWSGTKPPVIPGARRPAPLSRWEIVEGVKFEADIMANAMERIQGGQGQFNDYILMRFNMTNDCTDAELSEARQVLMEEIRGRLNQ